MTLGDALDKIGRLEVRTRELEEENSSQRDVLLMQAGRIRELEAQNDRLRHDVDRLREQDAPKAREEQ